MTRFRRQERSPSSRQVSGLQIHLGYLSKYQWSQAVERPSAMAVRTEQEVLDYVARILEIRELARKAGFREYIETEDLLLTLCHGTLPAAIKLRARWAYNNSPRVKVAEALYGDRHAKSPSLILREFQDQTGWGPAAFEEKLDGEWLRRWNGLKAEESFKLGEQV